MQTHIENKIKYTAIVRRFTKKILKQQLLITQCQLAQCYSCADQCNFGLHHNSFPELHRFWIGQISTHILCPILGAHFKKDSEELEQLLRRATRMIREPATTSYELRLKGMRLFKLLWCRDMIVCFRFLKGCHRKEAQLLYFVVPYLLLLCFILQYSDSIGILQNKSSYPQEQFHIGMNCTESCELALKERLDVCCQSINLDSCSKQKLIRCLHCQCQYYDCLSNAIYQVKEDCHPSGQESDLHEYNRLSTERQSRWTCG